MPDLLGGIIGTACLLILALGYWCAAYRQTHSEIDGAF